MSRINTLLLVLLILKVSLINCEEKKEVPQYLALVADNEIASAQVQAFIEQSMSKLKTEFPDAAPLIDEDMKSLKTTTPSLPWKNPSHYHTTVFYLGYDATKLESEYYKQFVPGKSYNLQSSTFVYIPGTIMTTPTYRDTTINIANKIPHITLKINKWAAFLSNKVLEALFIETGPLKTEYDNGFFMKQDETLIKRYQQMSINNEKVDVYIIKTNYNTAKHIDLKGIATECDDAKLTESSSQSARISTLLSSLVLVFVYLLI